MSISPRLLGMLLLSLPPKPWPQSRIELAADSRGGPYRWFSDLEELQAQIYYSLDEHEFETLKEHFGVLQQAGLIQPNDQDKEGGASSYPWSEWRLSSADELNGRYPGREQRDRPQDAGNGDWERQRGGRQGGGGMGGGGQGGGGQGGDNQNGDSGRGGIREVLGHATLFSLPREEFENWVNNLF